MLLSQTRVYPRIILIRCEKSDNADRPLLLTFLLMLYSQVMYILYVI